jgi:CHAT domain-containing protein
LAAQSEPAEPDEAYSAGAKVLADANAKGFEELINVRRKFLPPGSSAAAQLRLRELAVRTFLPWCTHALHAVAASKAATTLAIEAAELSLALDSDPQHAIALLESVWPFQELADYRVTELALTMAEARRAARDYAEVERALDHFAGLRGTKAWRSWLDNPTYAAMLQVHELRHASRRAMLELDLGNPDGALHHLHAATKVRHVKRRPPREEHEDAVTAAWQTTEVEYQRTRIEFYLATGRFGDAVDAADQVLGQPTLKERHPMFRFYRARAEFADPGTASAAITAAREVLEGFAENANPQWAREARLGLLERALLHADPAVEGEFAAWSDDTSHDPRAISLQTQWLLQKDRAEPLPAARIAEQAAAQARAWQQVTTSWAATPVRDGGVGFLHYVHRRNDLAQLVAITLRADERDGIPTAAAIAKALELVMAAQTHGALARALRPPATTAKAVQAALRPGHTVLVFLPARAGTHVFTVTCDELDHVQLPDGALLLRDGVQIFLDLLRDATVRLDQTPTEAEALRADLRKAGQALVDILFSRQVATTLAKTQALTVIGAELLHGPISGRAEAGFLNYLPIECLPWADDRLFGQQFAIDHNSSLPVWLQLMARDGVTGADSELCVFGVLGKDEGPAPRLVASAKAAAAADRADAAKKWFAGEREYLDAKCTITAVRGAGMSAARKPSPKAGRVAVFVGHGGYDAANERGSWLQLHDHLLHCTDAQALGRPDAPFADLVVLAACNAAKGPNRAGDSLANLGGAFLLAGASTVVQSRFELPLKATVSLLGTLLRELAAGTSCAEAMRAARAAASSLDAYRACVLQVHGCGQRGAPR